MKKKHCITVLAAVLTVGLMGGILAGCGSRRQVQEPQKQQSQRTFGCCRFVWNYYLAQRKSVYELDGRTMNYYECAKDMTVLKQSLSYIWSEFKKRRGIDCPSKGNHILENPLAEQTKKDYKLSFSHISQIKNNNGKRLIDLNLDMIQPQIVDSIYLTVSKQTLPSHKTHKKIMDSRNSRSV